ncbi:MAG: DUF1961 family protein [Cyclobacteriaceae bacterium]
MRTIKLTAFALFVIFSYGCSSRKKEIKHYDFEDLAQLSDWSIEGNGRAYISCGKLILEPEFYPEMKTLMDEGSISPKNDQSEYSSYLINAMKEKYKNELDWFYYHEKGKEPVFRGGHFNFWNRKFPTQGDFSIEFEFRSLSKAPLQMVMFCASGSNGEDIFDPAMPERYGLAHEIMYGPMAQYRISYFHPFRKTANMRRAPGREMVAQGRDLVSENPNDTYVCRVERKGSLVRYLVDGKEVLSFNDEDPIPGGYWGFRLMVCAKGEYDNIRISRLDD